MMWYGLYHSRRSPRVLLRCRFSSSYKLSPINLQTSLTAAFKASTSFTVQPLSKRHNLLFSEGRPTPPMFTPNKGDYSSSEEVSDREWQIRTGQSGMLLHRSPSDSTISPLCYHHFCLIVFELCSQVAPSISYRRHSLISLTLALCQT